MLAAVTRRLWITLAFAAGGLALLIWQVRATGIDNIARGFRAVGWIGFAGVLVISFLRYVARSTAWTAVIPADTPPGRALAAIIAGDAVGALTPLSLLVSEPAKAAYLGSAVPSVGIGGALAALIAETFFFSVSVAIYIISGAGLLLYAYPVDERIRTAGIAVSVVMVAVLSGATWLAWQKPAILSKLASRLRIRTITEFADVIRTFEQRAYGATGHTGARLGIVIACEALFHALSFAEMWLTLWLITGESHLAAAFILDSVGRAINVIFKMVPLQLGVLQIGSELVATALGLPPGTGVAVSLVRTMRLLAWAVVGFGLALRAGVGGHSQ